GFVPQLQSQLGPVAFGAYVADPKLTGTVTRIARPVSKFGGVVLVEMVQWDWLQTGHRIDHQAGDEDVVHRDRVESDPVSGVEQIERDVRRQEVSDAGTVPWKGFKRVGLVTKAPFARPFRHG